ncbi:TetR/AcrR family transcriptional regulator [Rhizobium oryzicola]|uniref:TetR/AcrR family transcriptional regulator n=1 Tax=Rhizobium oryzicola TaxID=1232668 RepID=A0ABT8SX48_9HYPH|nr:TetR/AcrR family transcriptional regulator [Rhizobium oryzicola]MDO1583034.1 TetR/AcrR family transcriptional regulator [Rhizobium oryzicola]
MRCKLKLTRAEQKALRPQQIIDAAFEEFARNGFAATRVEDIAARIGVTKGTVYVYFATKEDLFAAVVMQVSQPFAEMIPYIEAVEGTYQERLKKVIRLFYDKLMVDRRARELIRFMISEAPRFPDLVDRHDDEFMAPIATRIKSLIDQGVAAGEFRDGPASWFAEIICAPALMMTFTRVLFDNRRPLDEAKFVEAHIDIMMNGLAAN